MGVGKKRADTIKPTQREGGTLQEKLALTRDIQRRQRRQLPWYVGSYFLPGMRDSLILSCSPSVHRDEPLITDPPIKEKGVFLK
jgi:hypothetical protein